MKKKITKRISGKKFSKETLRHIIKEIYINYIDIESGHKRYLVTLHCANYETLEFRDVDFSEKYSDIFDTKKIYQFIVSYNDYQNNREIYFSINEGDDNYGNYLSIEGDDINWVNSTEKKLNDLLEVVEPRKNYYRKYSTILFHFSSLNVGFLALRIFVLLLNKFGYTSPNPTKTDNPIGFLLGKIVEKFPLVGYLIIIICSWLLGMLLLAWIFDKIEEWISSVFPSIEFDFGPMYMRKPKKLRKAIATLFTLIILPILLQLLFLIYKI